MIPKLFTTRLPFLPIVFGLLLLCTTTLSAETTKCKAYAGTLGQNQLCQETDKAVITATPNGDAYIPNGFIRLYVLTSGDDLVIEQLSPQAAFEVDPVGRYTIHSLVFDPQTLDLSIVMPGQTTGFDVNGLLEQGGGDICASLDVAGAKFSFDNCTSICGAFAGTLRPKYADCIENGSATIEAENLALPLVPMGYSVAYVLTSGDDLVIQATNSEPKFDVSQAGKYTIHTLVFDANTLDLNIVMPGQTTGFDVNALLIQGGGDICAALDVPGASFNVKDCDDACEADFGALKARNIACFNGRTWVRVAARVTEQPVVPEGFRVLYVFTSGDDLLIRAVSRYPVFFVRGTGKVRIHTLVYNPKTLDLSIVKLGKTKAGELLPFLVQRGGDICAALDVEGAAFRLRACGNHATAPDLRSSPSAGEMEVKAELPTSIADDQSIKVFPNPANEQLDLQIPAIFTEDNTVEMKVFNAFGQEVKSEQIKPGTSRRSLDISNLSDGMYLIQMRIGEEVYLQQFTKTKR